MIHQDFRSQDFPIQLKHVATLASVGGSKASLQELGPSDQARYPMLQQATPLEIFVEKGDMFYLPSAWWHCVSRPFLVLFFVGGGWDEAEFHVGVCQFVGFFLEYPP